RRRARGGHRVAGRRAAPPEPPVQRADQRHPHRQPGDDHDREDAHDHLRRTSRPERYAYPARPAARPPVSMSPISIIATILACMAALALVERLIPLHRPDARHRAHLAPNLALTALTFATNVAYNAGVVALLLWCGARGVGLVPWL